MIRALGSRDPDGCSQNIGLDRGPWRNAFVTSGWRMGRFRAVAIFNTVRTVASLQTVLTVSSKSTPGCWLNPRVTQCALYLSTEPSDRNLCLKRHLLETTLVERKVMKKMTLVIDKNVKALPSCNFFRTRRKESLLLFFTPWAKIETKRVWVFN